MHATDTVPRAVKSLSAIMATAFVLSSLGAAQAAAQGVAWTHQVNVAVRGTTLEKTGGCDGCDDAGAVSRQMIRSGDGYVEFRVGDPYAFWLAGLSHADGNPRFNEIDFGFRFNGNGWADVLENGSYQPNSDTESSEGDVFRVAVVGGRVQYLRNGRLILQSRRAPMYPLVFATALGSIGARVADVRIESRDTPTSTDRYNNNTIVRRFRISIGIRTV
jgi:hypothetical protein